MNKNCIPERVQNLRKKMEEKGISYYVIPTSDFHMSEYVNEYFQCREFLSGFTGSNGTLVVTKDEAGLWTDGRYFVQAQKELEGTGIVLYRMLEENVPTVLQYIENHLQAGEVVGFDGRVMSAEIGLRFQEMAKKKGGKLKTDEDLVDSLWENRPELPHKPVRILETDLCGESSSHKLSKLRKELREKGITSHVLTKLDDIMWLLNLRGEDITCNPVALSYFLMTDQKNVLFIQKEAVSFSVREYLKSIDVAIEDYNEIYRFLSQEPVRGKIWLYLKAVNYRLYDIMQKKGEILNQENPTEKWKAIKNAIELENIRKYYLLDSVVVTRFIFQLKQRMKQEEMTEYSAAKLLDGLRSEIPGFLEFSFPTISAYGANAAMMHYEATEDDYAILKPEGFLLVDSGGQYLGATTDVTRTIVLGELSEEMKRNFTLSCAGCLRLGNAHFIHGCTGINLDILARGPLWEQGIDYKCGTGHGIGYILNVHEGPHGIRWRQSDNGKDAVLENGMLVSDEPGVYKAGEYGIRIENILEVALAGETEDGIFHKMECLTYVPIDRRAIDSRYLNSQDLTYLNQYHEKVWNMISPYLNVEEREWLREETAPILANS